MKKIQWISLVLMCLIVTICNQIPTYANENISQREVKVGFFSADGYHIKDEKGRMSGYGYDFLQMMLRYNDWDYDFVGYDKNWTDMITMLDNGQIDMVTLANKTPEREEKYDFSDKSIGTSSTIMSVSSNNKNIIPGEYSTYNGTVIGLVEGSSHNEYFEKYAQKMGFSYTPKYYSDIADLLDDLRHEKNIDIAVTSNMRVLSDEIVLDEFNSTEYYVMVRKGENGLLSEINKGIDQLNVSSPDWKTGLFKKYYSDINSKVISLTVDERNYIKELKDSNTVLKVVMNPELKPYSYFEDGKPVGIVPDIFEEIAKRLGIKYKILYSADRWEYKEQLHSGKADIDLTAFLDFSLAQNNNLKETDAFITSNLAILSRRDSNINSNDMVIAVLRDPTEYIGYNSQLIDNYRQVECENVQECIDAVKEGKADATFVYVYVAEQAVYEDYTNKLSYTVLTDCPFSLALGIQNDRDHRMLSIFCKGVDSLTDSFIQGVILSERAKVKDKQSIKSIIYDYPEFVIIATIFVICIIFITILLLVRNKNQKAKIIASHEMMRFIGYICENYDLVVEVDMKNQNETIYRMENNELVEVRKKHILYTDEYIRDKVREEDLEKMVALFSKDNIDRMISEGGSHAYEECQIKEGDSYVWYSYIVKAVPKDNEHPENFIIFKKNIQNAKESEEKSRQVLMDALDNAKNASMAKGQFLSRMSHEIRTPLNAVIGYMNIAKDSCDNSDKVMHCVENSDIAAKHLLSIINDVLDISSIESGKMKIANEEFNLKNQITSISTMFFNQAKEKKVHFNTILNDVDKEWVIGDSLRLNQILMNLLSNAVKFTPKEGEVNLSVTQTKVDEENVYMTFTVSDTGIGMSEEYKKKLFTPFEQESASTARNFGGTGLGLSITFNLVKMMGGSIDVKSKKGEGSQFVVSLKFGIVNGEHRENKNQDYSKVRALIVDDDKGACEYIKTLLKRCGVKSDVVNDGQTAVKRIKGRLGSDYEYNMCIMDWNMPEMNGLETAKKIRQECSTQMPIIIATAYDITEIEGEAKQAGVDRIISKPLFQSTMFDLLVSTYGKYEPVQKIEHKSRDLEGLHILLAEDNEMNLEIETETLKKAGIIVDTVTDGTQAVEKFTKSKTGEYDAILMDIQMPVMDGYEATRTIRSSHHEEAKTIPIIAMTANAFAEDVTTALASGMNDHVSKPISFDKLYQVIFNHCRGKK